MPSPFEVYDIRHLSPSSLNTFSASPAKFILDKCLKVKTGVGAAAHRGTSVEAGVVHGLLNPDASLEDCYAIAHEMFSGLIGLKIDDKSEKERGSLAGMVKEGLLELRPYGIPTHTQGQVYLNVEGLDVPLMGFYDVMWADKKVLTDLKTTHAVSSKISVPHARQVSLYKAAMGGDEISARVSYISSKKSATYELENYKAHLNSLIATGKAVQRFLALSDDPLELASLVVPDVEHFYFNDEVTRQAAFEIWGV